MNHYFKVVKEAEEYPGPSLIIAYSPCIAHGIKTGMNNTIEQEKFAVKAGYWHLYRYNPMLEEEGKNPFTLDSKEPDWNEFQNYINSEVRYTQLLKSFPENAKELFALAEENAKWRYNSYRRMAEMDYSKK
jgi:pyruvate-ferredoxin/flavodoxin oxidoreductase